MNKKNLEKNKFIKNIFLIYSKLIIAFKSFRILVEWASLKESDLSGMLTRGIGNPRITVKLQKISLRKSS